MGGDAGDHPAFENGAALRAFAEFLRLHPDGEGAAFERFRAERCAAEPAVEPDLATLYTLYRQAHGLLRSVVGQSTLWEVGRMLASRPGDEPAPGAHADELSATLAGLAASASPRRRWVHEQRLGEGGMGVVDRVWDANLGREAARKTMVLPEGADPAARLRLFLDEIKVVSALDHPAIVPVYEAGLDEQERLFFVMKLVRGRNLEEVLHLLHGTAVARDGERWTLNRVLAHLVDAAQALAYAHSRGVLHRDVKPANIMLGNYGETYLLDWGLSRVFGGTADDPAGGGPAWVGTPSYMAPERVAGSAPEDPREDVYSLGAVLYHALVGHPPFLDQLAVRDRRALRELVLGARPTPVEQLAPDAPADLLELCAASMSPERARRPASAEEFARALQEYLADVSEDRVEARRQAARAQRTFDFLVDMIRQADPYVAQGREITVREVLERAAEQAGGRLQDEPEDAASMLTTLAELLLTMGRPRVAAPLLERAEALLAPLGERVEEARLRVLHERGRCAFKLGELDASERFFTELVRRGRERFGEDAESTLMGLAGLVDVLRCDYSRHGEMSRLARDLWERRCRVNGPEHVASLSAAVALAWSLRTGGELAEGEAVLQENVRLLVERHGSNHMQTIVGLTELANYLDAAGQLERARDIYADCAERYAHVVGPGATGRFICMANGAWLDHRLGDSRKAEGLLRAATDGLRANGDTDLLANLAAEQNLGLVLLELGRLDEACARLGAVVERAVSGPATLRAALGRFRSNWGRALLAAERRDAARAQLELALSDLRRDVGADHAWTRDAEAWLAQATAPRPQAG